MSRIEAAHELAAIEREPAITCTCSDETCRACRIRQAEAFADLQEILYELRVDHSMEVAYAVNN